MRGKRLRVAHVINTLGPGGAEALLYQLITQSSDIEHHVICLGRRDWYSPLIEQGGFPIYHLGITKWPSALIGGWRLGQLIRRMRPDVTQAWMYGSNLSAGVWAKIYGIPVICGVHAASLRGLSWGSRIAARLGGLLSRWLPDVVVFCSERAAEMHGSIGYSVEVRVVITNGADPVGFHRDEKARDSTRQTLDIDAETFLVGTIARWHARKDIPTLIRALGLLTARKIPFRCVLIGRGLDQSNEALMRELRRNGCTESVIGLGERFDISDLARAMDLHVLSSMTEAFGNAIAETMLSGTPNVATDSGGPPQIVGETGWIAAPGNPEQLAGAIEEAYGEWKDRPEAWEMRRAAARQRIEDNFTLDRMAKAYERVWKKVAGSPQATD